MKLNINQVAILPIEKERSLYFDATHDDYEHVSVRGRIIQVPPALDLAPGPGSAAWEITPPSTMDHLKLANEVGLGIGSTTEVLISEGEEVLFSYIVHMVCNDEGWYEDRGEDRVLITTYDMLSFNFNRMIPLNDYLFVEQIPVPGLFIEKSGRQVYAPENYIPGQGIVKYGQGVGQRVCFNRIQVAPEYKYHQEMNPGGLPLLRIAKSDCLFV